MKRFLTVLGALVLGIAASGQIPQNVQKNPQTNQLTGALSFGNFPISAPGLAGTIAAFDATSGNLDSVTIGSGLSYNGSTRTLNALYSGTVQSVSVGNLSPIFTASVSSPTVNPSITFSLSSAAQNSVLAGPVSGGAGAPSYRSLTLSDLPFSEGNLTETTSNVLVITGGTGAVIGSGTTIQVKQASSSQSGYLSSTDWSTFNGKQAAGNYITALTGDGTASGPGSAALTLATVNSNIGSFGDSTHSATITVNAKGLVTAAANTSISASGIGALVAANNLSDVASASTARTNLGLGTAAVKAASGSGGTVASVSGSITTGDVAVFADTSGTVKDGGALPVGTVTSVALTAPNIFSVSGSPITGSGTLAISLAPETANYVWAGPASGSAANPTFRALVGADLPNPSSTTLGGVESYAEVSHQWINTISTSGVPSSTQPSYSDLSGNGSTSITTLGTVTTGTWNATAVGAGYGGTGSSALPSSGQILVGNSGGTAYAPQNISGDASSLSSSGALTIGRVNGVSYPSSPSTNTVPVVTSSNTITYEPVPTAAGGTGLSGSTPFTTNGLMQASSTSALTTTLTPSGLTSIGVNSVTAASGTDLTLNAGSGTQNVNILSTNYVDFGVGSSGDKLYVIDSNGPVLGRGSSGNNQYLQFVNNGQTQLIGSPSNGYSVNVGMGGTNTSTSGSPVGLEISDSYNQTSGTAANTDLLINRTQTAVGSGSQNLILATVNGTTMFGVNNSGTAYAVQMAANSFYAGAGGSATAPAFYLTGTATGLYFNSQIEVDLTASGSRTAAFTTAADTFYAPINIPGGSNALLTTTSSITSGAGSSTGTLTNAPSSGNPTKWVPINDNGTTRYIPAW